MKNPKQEDEGDFSLVEISFPMLSWLPSNSSDTEFKNKLYLYLYLYLYLCHWNQYEKDKAGEWGSLSLAAIRDQAEPTIG